jgi:hypothetical protein
MIRISLVLAAVAFVAALAVSHAQERAGRFDYLVRADMFYGFEGDEEAFERAMALCEQRLAANPDDPEPLAWHGVGLMFRSVRAAMADGREQAAGFGRQGFAEMARAVALAPDTVGVLIPRGAVLLAGEGNAGQRTGPRVRAHGSRRFRAGAANPTAASRAHVNAREGRASGRARRGLVAA